MNTRISRTHVLLLLALFILSAFTAPALAASGGATIIEADIRMQGEARVGQPVTFTFDLKGYHLPIGAYASVNVRHISLPDEQKPAVKAGYPNTIMTFPASGTYRFSLILNEITKPSCGGVEAKKLVDKVMDIEIVR